MNREDIKVARCTVERFMKRMKLQGVHSGKVISTAVQNKEAPCLLDRANRQFKAGRPNQLWMWDFTYFSILQSWQYMAFGFDVLEPNLFDMQTKRADALIHHSDRGLKMVPFSKRNT